MTHGSPIALLHDLRKACDAAIKLEEQNGFLQTELTQMHSSSARMMLALTEAETRLKSLSKTLADVELENRRLKETLAQSKIRTRVKRREMQRKLMSPKRVNKKALV